MALKTRRQPLHKRDGRRTKAGIKAGTTSHGKLSLQDDTDDTKKTQILQEMSPTVSIPVFKMKIESVETTSQHLEVNDSQSSLSKTLQGIDVSVKVEPGIQVTRLTESSHEQTEVSTPKNKKKKSKSTKRDSKSKKKPSHSNGDASSTFRNDTETKKRHAKSNKKHAKAKKDGTKPNQNAGTLKDSKKRPSQCQEENERRDHLQMHKCSSGLLSETKLDVGGPKEIPTKSGLLLEKEIADKKKKTVKENKRLLKVKEVKRQAAQSKSSRTKDKNKGKRKTLKLDTLFGKSKRAKLTDIPREMHVNQLDGISQTENGVKTETVAVTDGNVAAGNLARPTLGKAGIENTAKTRKTKHGKKNHIS